MVVMFWTMAAAFAASLLGTSPVFAQEKRRIYLGPSSKTLGYSSLWVATGKGFFDQQGMDVQLVLLRGMPMTVQALAANFGARTRFRCHQRHYQRHRPVCHRRQETTKPMKICAAQRSARPR
jgi:hypothetical protein